MESVLYCSGCQLFLVFWLNVDSVLYFCLCTRFQCAVWDQVSFLNCHICSNSTLLVYLFVDNFCDHSRVDESSFWATISALTLHAEEHLELLTFQRILCSSTLSSWFSWGNSVWFRWLHPWIYNSVSLSCVSVPLLHSCSLLSAIWAYWVACFLSHWLSMRVQFPIGSNRFLCCGDHWFFCWDYLLPAVFPSLFDNWPIWVPKGVSVIRW